MQYIIFKSIVFNHFYKAERIMLISFILCRRTIYLRNQKSLSYLWHIRKFMDLAFSEHLNFLKFNFSKGSFSH